MTTLTLAPAATIDPQAAVDALTEAMALLDRAGQALPRIAFLACAAHQSADTALIIASNEAKLARRGE